MNLKVNNATEMLKEYKDKLTKQQYRTFQGLVKSGREDAVVKGIETLKKRWSKWQVDQKNI